MYGLHDIRVAAAKAEQEGVLPADLADAAAALADACDLAGYDLHLTLHTKQRLSVGEVNVNQGVDGATQVSRFWPGGGNSALVMGPADHATEQRVLQLDRQMKAVS